MSRLPRFAAQSGAYVWAAFLLLLIGIGVHGQALFSLILPGSGFDLSVGNAASMIGLELAVIALLAAIEPSLRGMSAGLLFLSAATALLTGTTGDPAAGMSIAWQTRAHIMVALLSYG
ncbi:MAG: hypothetical protein KJN77_08895, partial [Gammaproteobacteria bacterium]|nr:hypothetical protein [Gammaproteobacteria bacterium]